MRSVLTTCRVCVGVLCLLALSADAKLLSVTGKGVIVSANNPIPQYRLPANLYDQRGPDHEDSTSATIPPISSDPRRDLAITAFDEKRTTVPADMIISNNPLVTLHPGILYDSHFIFFHQKQPSTQKEFAHALATFITDNRFVGCTQTNDQEFETTPIFGLTDQIEYPLALAADYATTGRKFEAADYVIDSGTQFVVNMNITQPGDYARCFSAACVDADGQACQCSVSSSMCISPAVTNEPRYHCFPDAKAIIAEPRFIFSSTCLVDKSSLEGTVKECKEENGCRIHPTTGDYCILAAITPSSSITLNVTGGCGCSKDIVVSFTRAFGGAGCTPADDVIDPPSVCGDNHPVTTVGTSCSSAHAASSTPGVTLQFSDAVTNCN